MDRMREDNVYPRRTTVQVVPPEQEKEADEQHGSVMEQYTIIKAVIDQLNKAADFYEFSVKAVSDDGLSAEKTEQFMREVMSNKKAAVSIRAEALKLEALVEEHVNT